MTEDNAQQLRRVVRWQVTTASVAFVLGAAAAANLANWIITKNLHGHSGGAGSGLMNLMIVVSTAGMILCFVIAGLSAAVAVNVVRRRRHRFNVAASLVGLVFVPIGTIAGVITVAVLNRDHVRVAFGVPACGEGATQQGDGANPPPATR